MCGACHFHIGSNDCNSTRVLFRICYSNLALNMWIDDLGVYMNKSIQFILFITLMTMLCDVRTRITRNVFHYYFIMSFAVLADSFVTSIHTCCVRLLQGISWKCFGFKQLTGPCQPCTQILFEESVDSCTKVHMYCT